jgi:hypothetical protein
MLPLIAGDRDSLVLDDGTRIFFGSVPRTDATWDDYLMKTRETLLAVVSTYQAEK